MVMMKWLADRFSCSENFIRNADELSWFRLREKSSESEKVPDLRRGDHGVTVPLRDIRLGLLRSLRADVIIGAPFSRGLISFTPSFPNHLSPVGLLPCFSNPFPFHLSLVSLCSHNRWQERERQWSEVHGEGEEGEDGRAPCPSSRGIILVASAVGVAAPVALARFLSRYPSYPSLLLLVKCFAAGVVLSTSLVHVLPDASTSLISSCHVSPDGFPFSGLVTLIGALLSLLVELSATHSHSHEVSLSIDDGVAPINGSGLNPYTKVGAQEMACHKGGDLEKHGVDGEGEVTEDEEQRMVMLKQKMVSKVLEIGIVFHFVIIGVTVGMSQDVCSIRPLMIALSFHQIFEGMGLGGCIAQAVN
ncbi:hypothetical protein LUZ61_007966 [Rhynchospora tenuis]|uniref:Uncharacterized protein n=1 Tax=Rhynchospora tenuis TaxID=198213 RepID=A0AAD6EX13_9POAL|nr:hypothetical protein LUZ61_007966 [Rhynchospora tenuis]